MLNPLACLLRKVTAFSSLIALCKPPRNSGASGDGEPDEAVGEHASLSQLHRGDRREWDSPVSLRVAGATEALPVDRQPVPVDRDQAVGPLWRTARPPLSLYSRWHFRPAAAVTDLRTGPAGRQGAILSRLADVAQLVEHFTRNEGVRGSSPRVGFWLICRDFSTLGNSGEPLGGYETGTSLDAVPSGEGV